MAERIARAVSRWDPNEEVAKRVTVHASEGNDSEVLATFANKGDEQDASAYADGFADGWNSFEEAEDDADDLEEEDPDSEEEEEDE